MRHFRARIIQYQRATAASLIVTQMSTDDVLAPAGLYEDHAPLGTNAPHPLVGGDDADACPVPRERFAVCRPLIQRRLEESLRSPVVRWCTASHGPDGLPAPTENGGALNGRSSLHIHTQPTAMGP